MFLICDMWYVSDISHSDIYRYHISEYDIYIYISYSEIVFNTLHIEIKHKCWKKFPSDKINGTKNDLFFYSRAPSSL